ncbi:type II toxin-antitoxin system HipA family toxin, partial [Streptomyces sp. ZYX-F-203]
LAAFDRLERALDRRLGTSHGRLREEAVQTIEQTRANWPQFEEHLADNKSLSTAIGTWITESARRLLGSP